MPVSGEHWPAIGAQAGWAHGISLPAAQTTQLGDCHEERRPRSFIASATVHHFPDQPQYGRPQVMGRSWTPMRAVQRSTAPFDAAFCSQSASTEDTV